MKKILYFFVFSTLFLNSCSSSSDDPSSNNPSVPLVKTMIIDDVNPANNDFNLLFTYSDTKLLNVKDSGVLIEEYLYTADKLTRVNHPEDNTYIVIEYNGNQVSKFIEYDPDSNSATKTLVTYSGNTFTRAIYDGDLTTQTTLLFTEVCTVQNGNLTQLTHSSSGTTSTETITYDSKNNPFKNISNYDVFQVLDLDIEGNLNNDIDISSPGNHDTVTYTYNTDNYPLTERTYNSSTILKETVTYGYY